jgi:hypothetical protein
MHICTEKERFYINIMGREYRVHAVLDTDEEANAYMQANEGSAVIAVQDGRIYIASKNDTGVTKH